MLSFITSAVTEAEAQAYAEARGYYAGTAGLDLSDITLRRGQDYIAGLYNSRWRVLFDDATAPDAVKFAIIEAARRESQAPGSLSPDVAGGQLLKSAEAGPVSVTYQDGKPAAPSFPLIDGLLSGLIVSGSVATSFLARA